MIKELIYFDYLDKEAKGINLIKTFITILSMVFIFSFFTLIDVKSNAYMAIVVHLSSYVIAILQVMLHSEIKGIRHDPIVVFLKKERYTYIKTKVQLKVVKVILLVVVPMLLPLIIYSKGNMSFIAVSILSILNFYFFNTVLTFSTKYLSFMYWRNVLYRFIYIIGIVTLAIAVINLEIFISEEILIGLIRSGGNSFNFYSESYIMILSISLLIEIILYVIILKLVKNNLHVIANNSNRYKNIEKSFSGRMLKVKINNLYGKILFKDLSSFIRKKELGFYLVILVQIISYTFYYFTILKEKPINLIDKFYFVAVFYVICGFASVFLIAIAAFTNFKMLKINDDVDIFRRFKVKADISKLIAVKSKVLFLMTSIPILGMIFTNLVLEIKFNSLLQTLCISLLLLSSIRYWCLIIVDINNFKGNELRSVIFIVVTVISIKLMVDIAFLNKFINISDLVLKYSTVILLNTVAYYASLILVRFQERSFKID
ncbi:hypothetical protein ACOAKC_08490 [Hathewaya histolytica]|uniref:hypothetical protein n=1 Tax=Hathewaya histolytica TaxID=1498 RepID=UPI003B672458